MSILTGAAANNPFAEDAASYSATGTRLQDQPQEGQYYGRGYTQAQSGYSSAGLGTFNSYTIKKHIE